MENYLFDIATLLVAGVVGGILVAQVKKQNEMINNLKSYVSIIDIDKIKKYADLRSESDNLRLEIAVKKASEMLSEKMARSLIKKHVEPRLKEYEQEIASNVDELMNLVFDVVTSQPKGERVEFINEYLPLNKEYILPQLEEYELAESNENTPTS